MARDTSVQAYQTIRERGLLSRRRWQVYDVLYRYGPLTAGEIAKQVPGAQLNSISPRLAELRDRGVVREEDPRSCGITGHQAISWDVTSKLPQTVAKKKPTWPDKAAAEVVALAAGGHAFSLQAVADTILRCYRDRRK